MTRILFSLIILLSCCSLFGQTYTLRLGINDCINCNAYIVNLKNYLGQNPLHIILPTSYQSDKEIIIKKYLLEGLNMDFEFSDEKFNVFSSPKSYFIIAENNNIMDTFLLSDVEFSSIFAEKQESVCLTNVNNFHDYKQYENILLFKNYPLSKFGVYEINKGMKQQLYADNVIAKENYKALYGKEWEAWYEVYKRYANVYPMVGTEFLDVLPYEILQNRFFLLSQSSIIIPPQTGTDTNAVKIKFFNIMTLDDATFENTSIVIPTASLTKGYYLQSQFFFYDHFIYLPMGYSQAYNKNVQVLSKYHYDATNNAIIFDKVLPFTIPPTYIQSGLNDNLNWFIKDKRFMTMSHSNVVYDCKNEKTYEVWEVNNPLFDSLSTVLNPQRRANHFGILDIADVSAQQFRLLITNNKNQLEVIVFDIDKNKIREQIMVDSEFSFTDIEFSPRFDHKDKKKVVYKKKNESCFSAYP